MDYDEQLKLNFLVNVNLVFYELDHFEYLNLHLNVFFDLNVDEYFDLIFDFVFNVFHDDASVVIRRRWGIAHHS